MNKEMRVVILGALLCMAVVPPLATEAATASMAQAAATPAATRSAASSGTTTSRDRAADAVALSSYYLTSGEKFTQITTLLENLPPALTGLNHDNGDYFFRVDKELTSDCFYHAQAFFKDTKKLRGDFLVAKDDSCAWRLDTGKEAALIYGSADKLLKKASIRLLTTHIAMGSVGRVKVRVPGNLPYDVKLTSLNESVARISTDQGITPVAYGKVDILAELKVGNSIRTEKLRAYVVDREEWDEENRGSSRPTIGIGIGIGGWHHHHGGGIDIGIGGVVWDN